MPDIDEQQALCDAFIVLYLVKGLKNIIKI